MPPAKLAATSRYYIPGTRKIYEVETIADITAPTLVEVDAGTDLTCEVRPDGVSGFQVSTETVDVPDLCSTFVGSIGGASQADDSSLTFYADEASADIRAALPRGLKTNILMLWEGNTLDGGTGTLMDVFPVEVLSRELPTEDGAGTIVVNFSITAEPAEDVTIPIA